MFANLTSFLHIHALIGTTALISFWLAALSQKGSIRHILAGRAYLISMSLVLITTIPIIFHFFELQDYKRVLTLIYLFFVTMSGLLLLYFPIKKKRSIFEYKGILYQVLAWFMTFFASVILFLSLTNTIVAKKILLFGFSSIGYFIGISMLVFFYQPSSNKWWLNQHLNGAMVLFAATHASFFGLGLRKIVPLLSGEWMHTLTQVGIIFLAYFIRWRLIRLSSPNTKLTTV